MNPRLSVILVLAAAATLLQAEPTSSLRPTNYVNDFAGVLDAATQARLNNLCFQVEQKANAQITVVTVKSLDGEKPVDYAVNLYQEWGVGTKRTDRGVLILLATQDRKYWTAVGYGLEPILPDGKVGGFGREAVPLLRNGDYNGAVTLMTSRVADVIAKEAGVTLGGMPATPRAPPQETGEGLGKMVGFIVLLIVFLILLSVFRGGSGRYGGGGGSGFLSGLLWGILLNSGRRGGGYGGYSGGFGGGGWGGGGFGGGGGGFGGFGGGSTGGGGAGGSW